MEKKMKKERTNRYILMQLGLSLDSMLSMGAKNLSDLKTYKLLHDYICYEGNPLLYYCSFSG